MMNASDFSAAASRLCLACGLCCNGVLFHIVRLQPSDSRPTLQALGLRLKKKKKQFHFAQPCSLLKDNCCGIYTARPERCRLFECRQLHRLQEGAQTELETRQHIEETQQQVSRVEGLLTQAGNDKVRQPLSERYGRVLAEPAIDESMERRQQALRQEMQALNEVLNRDFRLEPIPLPSSGEGAVDEEGEPGKALTEGD